MGRIDESKDKEWMYSASSEDERKEVVYLCLLAIANDDHLTKDHVAYS